MAHGTQQYETVLLPPTLSPDGEYLAALAPNHNLQIFNLRSGLVVSEIRFPPSSKTFVSQIQSLKWAPEIIIDEDLTSTSQAKTRTAWLLLTGDYRLVALKLAIPVFQRQPILTIDAQIVADYSFETQNGQIVLAEFVFNQKQAFVTFEMNTVASLISFDKPQRDDISSPKFRTRHGYAQSSRGQYFALLLRSKGQDQIVTFSQGDQTVEIASNFNPATLDAQGLKWSPNNDPLLAVWESAAYGLMVCFYTALGHPLKQLDLRQHDLISGVQLQQHFNVGLTHFDWAVTESEETMLAVGYGGAELMLRYQKQRLMKLSKPVSYQHKAIVDGSRTAIWQQVKHELFEQQETLIDVQMESGSEINLVKINVDSSMLATRLDTVPRAVWIWDHKSYAPVGLILFQSEVRRVLWHPVRNNVLAVVTDEKAPCVYVYHTLYKQPQKVLLPQESVVTGRWTAQWSAMTGSTRCPILISGKKHFFIGLLSLVEGEVVFESLLRDAKDQSLEGDSSLFDTPSKVPANLQPSRAANALDETLWLRKNPNSENW